MKKFFKIFLAAAIAVTLAGCDNISHKEEAEPAANSSPESSETESQDNSHEETQPATLADRDRVLDTDSTFIFDDAQLLSEDVAESLNSYGGWLSKTLKTNICIVTADSLGDYSPEEYAKEYYSELYGSQNGVMFLINNETGSDYILKSGAPSLFFEQQQEQMFFADISPLLVTGEYEEPIEEFFRLCELSLPEFAIDRTNKMTAEQITEINGILSAGSINLSVIYLEAEDNLSLDDYALENATGYLSEESESAVMTINCKTGEYYISSTNSMEEEQETIKEDMESCIEENTDSEETVSYDYKKAAEIFVNFAAS